MTIQRVIQAIGGANHSNPRRATYGAWTSLGAADLTHPASGGSSFLSSANLAAIVGLPRVNLLIVTS